jgi:hypothetical protein
MAGELPKHNSEEPPRQRGEAIEGEHLIPLSELPGHLGFAENEETLRIKIRFIDIIANGNPEAIGATRGEWAVQAEKMVEQRAGEDYIRAQVGMIIAEALVWQSAGDKRRYLDCLSQAEEFARNMRYEDVVHALDVAIEESKIKQELQEPSEKEAGNS